VPTITFSCLRPGLQSLIVDAGRSGPGQAYGVPVGGALDRRSARLANWLVGNPPGTPTLEMSLHGARLRSSGPAQVALTGARATATINDTPVDPYETLELAAGDTLNIGGVTAGCRVYLAIGGDWAVPRLLGSQSALYAGGSYYNGQLRQGDELRVATRPSVHRRALDPREWWQPAPECRLPVYPGPELEQLSSLVAARFFGSVWTVGADSNRMGIRLEGGPLPGTPAAMLSSPVLPGTIQVPPGGLPLLLLADAQTTGGYPRIATVAEAALDELGQLAPGQRLRFTLR
jgi:antagonist of KipI